MEEEVYRGMGGTRERGRTSGMEGGARKREREVKIEVSFCSRPKTR